MPAVLGQLAAADFPADEAGVRRERVPIGTERGRCFNGHIHSFAHTFEILLSSVARGPEGKGRPAGPASRLTSWHSQKQ